MTEIKRLKLALLVLHVVGVSVLDGACFAVCELDGQMQQQIVSTSVFQQASCTLSALKRSGLPAEQQQPVASWIFPRPSIKARIRLLLADACTNLWLNTLSETPYCMPATCAFCCRLCLPLLCLPSQQHQLLRQTGRQPQCKMMWQKSLGHCHP
jgi:hypothetical protein